MKDNVTDAFKENKNSLSTNSKENDTEEMPTFL